MCRRWQTLFGTAAARERAGTMRAISLFDQRSIGRHRALSSGKTDPREAVRQVMAIGAANKWIRRKETRYNLLQLFYCRTCNRRGLLMLLKYCSIYKQPNWCLMFWLHLMFSFMVRLRRGKLKVLRFDDFWWVDVMTFKVSKLTQFLYVPRILTTVFTIIANYGENHLHSYAHLIT